MGGDVAAGVQTMADGVRALSKLGESNIMLDLRLELRGEVSKHVVQVALNELQGR